MATNAAAIPLNTHEPRHPGVGPENEGRDSRRSGCYNNELVGLIRCSLLCNLAEEERAPTTLPVVN